MMELEQARWNSDIDSFERWKRFLSNIKTQEVRQRVIGYLKGIQARWPQYIKLEEIPEK